LTYGNVLLSNISNYYFDVAVLSYLSYISDNGMLIRDNEPFYRRMTNPVVKVVM